MRERPMRTRADTATAMRGSRRSSVCDVGETAGWILRSTAKRCWLIAATGPWSVSSASRSAVIARSRPSASGVVSR